MLPPSLLPVEIDLFDDEEDFRTQFRHLFSSIASLGDYTTACIDRLVQEEEAFNEKVERNPHLEEKPVTFLSQRNVARQLQALYDEWSRHLITHMDDMREIRFYQLSEADFGLDAEGKKRKFKGSNGIHVFFELTRVNYLVHYPRLLEEMDNLSIYEEGALSSDHYLMLYSLKRTTHSSFVAIVDSFDISALYEEKEDPDQEVEEMRRAVKVLWDKPVMQYTQTQVEIVILFLTQQLNEVPTKDGTVVEEYRKVFLVLWLRIAQFFNEFHSPAILDNPEMRKGPFETGDPNDVNTCVPNQNFLAFCFFYMVELLRRFFYYDALIHNKMDVAPPPGLRERTKAWVTRIMESIAEDAFEDIYADNMPKGYEFVGDDNWFKFSQQGVHSRGACIALLRPHLHKRFFSQNQVTPHSVLSTTNDSYVSRLFVLRTIDEHLKIQLSRVRFLNAAVVMNDGIEMSAYKLQTNLVPVLLQVFSSFWPYDQGRVYVCDDIYEAVGVWFWLVQQRYQGRLYDCDLTSILPHIVSLAEEEMPSINVHQDFSNFEF